MTPEALAALALYLMDLRDWLDDTDPGSLDRTIVDRCIDVCAEVRNRLILGGAR